MTTRPRIEHAVLLHALMKLGAVALPLNLRLGEERSRCRARRRGRPGVHDRRARSRREPTEAIAAARRVDSATCSAAC